MLKTDPSGPRLLQTLSHAITILELFTSGTPEWAAGEVAQRLDMNLSTTHRLLVTLETFGYLERSSPGGKFRPGLKALQLSFVALNQSELYRHSLPLLEELAMDLKLHATVVILYQGDAMYFSRADAGGVASLYSIGRKIPLLNTAAGKVLASLVSLGDRKKLVAAQKQLGAPGSAAPEEQILAELEAVRQAGVAVDNAEYAPNTRAIAVPLQHSTRPLPPTALTLSGNFMQFPEERVPEVIDRLMAAASRLSFSLGDPMHSL